MAHPTTSWVLIPATESPGATLDRTGASVAPGVDLVLDSDGDLVVDTDAHFTTGLLAVSQGARIRLQMFKGEWFLDLDKGVPWLPNDIVADVDAILGQRFNEVKVRGAIRPILQDTPGVITINKLDISFTGSTRALRVDWRVTTTDGTAVGVTEF